MVAFLISLAPVHPGVNAPSPRAFALPSPDRYTIEPGLPTALPLSLVYLNVPDVAALALTDDEILAAVEVGLRAQGEGRTVIGPREHLIPRTAADGAPIRGHFNVLRGHIATLDLAGVKIAGDHVDNYTLGLPSERGLLTLFDPRTDAGDSASGRRCATDERRRAAR